VTDGDPNDGIVASGEREISVLVPEDETISVEVYINGNVEPQRLFDGGCTNRRLSLVPPAGPLSVRGTSIPGRTTRTPLLVTLQSTPQDYSVCAYDTAVTWGFVGRWRWIDDAWIWDVQSDDAPSQPSGWLWNEGTQQWESVAPQEDWTWNGTAWIYTGSEPARPTRPASPPAVPDTLPPSGGEDYLSITLTLLTAQMPIIDDIEIDLESTIATNAGTIVIPGVIPVIGEWRWIAATNEWERRNPGVDWRWHSQEKVWQTAGVAATVWRYNMGSNAMEYIGDPIEGWQWSGDWTWTAEGPPDTPSGGLPLPPGGPPTQGGSIYPPDLATWTWNGTSWSGGIYSAESRVPGGPWEGSTVMHIFTPLAAE
jgi:hypothetical protein